MSLVKNGIGFFLKYATQWGVFLTIICFLLTWNTCRLEINIKGEELVLMQDPNDFT